MADATETSDETADELVSVDATALGDYLDEPYGEVRNRAREMFAEGTYERVSPDVGMKEYREQVLKWAERLADEGHTLSLIHISEPTRPY